MGWLFFLSIVLISSWAYAIYALGLSFTDTKHDHYLNMLGIIYFSLIWLLSFWGLRQKPGFHKRYIQDKATQQILDELHISSSKQKYLRSGFDIEMATKLAEKSN